MRRNIVIVHNMCDSSPVDDHQGLTPPPPPPTLYRRLNLIQISLLTDPKRNPIISHRMANIVLSRESQHSPGTVKMAKSVADLDLNLDLNSDLDLNLNLNLESKK
jgi:hypothetical protein